MEFFATDGVEAPKLTGTTLIMPVVSIGNVGQLAIDLLITNGHLKRVGCLEEPNVLPCAGNDAFGPFPEGNLTVAMEVFQDSNAEITVVQQRAPTVKKKFRQFIENFATWISKSGFVDVIILSGFEAGRQMTSQLFGREVRYLSTEDSVFSVDDDTDPSSGYGDDDVRCETLRWKKLGTDLSNQRASSCGAAEGEAEMQRPLPGRLYGLGDDDTSGYGGGVGCDSAVTVGERRSEGGDGGLKRAPFWKMFEKFKEKKIKTMVVVLFCSEGDNLEDSMTMANYVKKALAVFSARLLRGALDTKGRTNWQIPISWASLYGPALDDSLF